MPKFKVGDVIRVTDQVEDLDYRYTILRVDEEYYTVKTHHDDCIWDWLHSVCDMDHLDSGYKAAKQFDDDLKTLLEE